MIAWSGRLGRSSNLFANIIGKYSVSMGLGNSYFYEVTGKCITLFVDQEQGHREGHELAATAVMITSWIILKSNLPTGYT